MANSNENGNGATMRTIITGLLIIFMAVLAFIAQDKASNDKVDGVIKQADSNSASIIRMDEKLDTIITILNR